MKLAKLAKLALAVVAATSTPTAAGVQVAVDGAAPVSGTEVAEAVNLRWQGDEDVAIHVARQGEHDLVITIGERSRTVRLADDEGAASARVVAIVILSMLDESPSVAAAHDDDTPAALATPPPGSSARRWALQLGGRISREDSGYTPFIVTGGAAWPIAPHVRVAGMLGLGHTSAYLDTQTTLVPVRLGIEASAGAAGIELGGQITAFREASCSAAQWGAASSVYGAAKAFLPLDGHKRLILELGGNYVVANDRTGCNSFGNYLGYSGWLGATVEWSR